MTGSEGLGELRALGDRVREAWRAVAFDVERFAAVAFAALRDDPPCVEKVEWVELVREFMRWRDPPAQFATRFGQPQITVYRHPRFYIEVLFWMDGAPEIHRHNFHGAFQVLAGSSLHVRHGFTVDRQVSQALLLGEARVESLQVLRPGDTVAIDGARLVHSLYHLERPSVTLVVRTSAGFAGPQYSYLPPHVAYDPFLHDPTLDKQLEVLALLRRAAPAEHVAMLVEFAGREDLYGLLRALIEGGAHLEEAGTLAPVLAAGRAVHGEAMDRVAASLARRWWEMDLVLRRARVPTPDHRFLLGLLAALPDAESIRAQVASRTGGDPCAAIMGWIRELARTGPDGSLELLGVRVTHTGTAHADRFGAQLGEAFLAVFEGLLRGRTEAEVVATLCTRWPALTPAQAERVLVSWAPLRGSAFRPLLR